EAMTFNNDGKVLAAACSSDNLLQTTIRVWQVSTGQEAFSFRGDGGLGRSLQFHKEDKAIALLSGDQRAQGWDIATGKTLASVDARRSGNVAAPFDRTGVFSADGKWWGVASADHAVALYDAAKWEKRATLEGHTGAILSLACSPDGQTLASASLDNSIRLWDL